MMKTILDTWEWTNLLKEDGLEISDGEIDASEVHLRLETNISKGKYQIINWFPEWLGIGGHRVDGNLSHIYEWAIWFAFWEIRKWQ